MSTDFTDRAPLLRDSQPLQGVRPEQWPMVLTALFSVFALFILASLLLLFACHRIAGDITASPPSTWHRNQHVPPPPAPLCPEAVAALPLVRARAGQEFYCCAVCLAEYEERERVKLMPVCGHVFHPDCIDTWLFSRGSCPVCRCSDLSGSRKGEVRLDVFEREGEEEEEEAEHHTHSHSHRKIRRGRSCSSSLELEGNGYATVFLQRSCSF